MQRLVGTASCTGKYTFTSACCCQATEKTQVGSQSTLTSCKGLVVDAAACNASLLASGGWVRGSRRPMVEMAARQEYVEIQHIKLRLLEQQSMLRGRQPQLETNDLTLVIDFVPSGCTQWQSACPHFLPSALIWCLHSTSVIRVCELGLSVLVSYSSLAQGIPPSLKSVGAGGIVGCCCSP